VCLAADPTDENKRAAAAQVAEAAALLDEADRAPENLPKAEQKLRLALGLNPDEPAAFVELARYRMKSSGLNPTSLRQAEELLRRAIAIAPTFGNAYVLLGYVLTHSNRLKEAQAAFDSAKRYRATSPWLDLNIAELEERQGNRKLAAQAYQRVVKSPKSPIHLKTSALSALQKYYVHEKQFDQADRAYRKQIELDPDHPWWKGNYSAFLRVYRKDLDRSERYAREALAIMDYGMARQSLASTLYLKWAEAVVRKDGKRASELYAEAQMYHPDPALVLEEVGSYPKPHPIVAVLASKGISVSTMSGIASGTTPLTVAIAERNRAAAAQLVKAGADPNADAYEGITPLIVAAQNGDEAMVRFLLKAGADPTLLSRAGKDAEQYARENRRAAAAQLLASAKQTYVRPANAPTPAVPFRVQHIYRVKKDWYKTTGVKDPTYNFLAGEEVIFNRAMLYGTPDRISFLFDSQDGKSKELAMDTKDVPRWGEYFEEVGPAPAQAAK
jgi:tetratricopeptide (TPR) repeat protein